MYFYINVFIFIHIILIKCHPKLKKLEALKFPPQSSTSKRWAFWKWLLEVVHSLFTKNPKWHERNNHGLTDIQGVNIVISIHFSFTILLQPWRMLSTPSTTCWCEKNVEKTTTPQISFGDNDGCIVLLVELTSQINITLLKFVMIWI